MIDGVDVIARGSIILFIVIVIGGVVLEDEKHQIDALDAFCAEHPQFQGEATRTLVEKEHGYYYEINKSYLTSRDVFMEVNCTAWNNGEYVMT